MLEVTAGLFPSRFSTMAYGHIQTCRWTTKLEVVFLVLHGNIDGCIDTIWEKVFQGKTVELGMPKKGFKQVGGAQQSVLLHVHP